MSTVWRQPSQGSVKAMHTLIGGRAGYARGLWLPDQVWPVSAREMRRRIVGATGLFVTLLVTASWAASRVVG